MVGEDGQTELVRGVRLGHVVGSADDHVRLLLWPFPRIKHVPWDHPARLKAPHASGGGGELLLHDVLLLSRGLDEGEEQCDELVAVEPCIVQGERDGIADTVVRKHQCAGRPCVSSMNTGNRCADDSVGAKGVGIV